MDWRLRHSELFQLCLIALAFSTKSHGPFVFVLDCGQKVVEMCLLQTCFLLAIPLLNVRLIEGEKLNDSSRLSRGLRRTNSEVINERVISPSQGIVEDSSNLENYFQKKKKKRARGFFEFRVSILYWSTRSTTCMSRQFTRLVIKEHFTSFRSFEECSSPRCYFENSSSTDTLSVVQLITLLILFFLLEIAYNSNSFTTEMTEPHLFSINSMSVYLRIWVTF